MYHLYILGPAKTLGTRKVDKQSILLGFGHTFGFGNTLAAGLLGGTQLVLEMSGSEWNRVGWIVRLLFAGAPALLAQWPHNMAGDVILPAPFDEWRRGAGPIQNYYRTVHSCFPPEVFVIFSEDIGQPPVDSSFNDLTSRGCPAIFIPNQRFTAIGNEVAFLMEGLHILARLLPDAAGIEAGFINAALGSAESNPDTFGLSPGVSPTCDTMLRGGIVRGATVSTYL